MVSGFGFIPGVWLDSVCVLCKYIQRIPGATWCTPGKCTRMLGNRDLDALETATREHDRGRQPSRPSAHHSNPLQLLHPVAHAGPEDIAVERGTARDVLGVPPEGGVPPQIRARLGTTALFDVRGLVRRSCPERERAHPPEGEAVSDAA